MLNDIEPEPGLNPQMPPVPGSPPTYLPTYTAYVTHEVDGTSRAPTELGGEAKTFEMPQTDAVGVEMDVGERNRS